MPEGKPIKLTPAKGRPMLQWVGKRPLDRVTAFPAQLIERFSPVLDAQGEGLIFHGDNKDVLAWLLANGYRGKINLVYIDPPFDSGADYVRKIELRGLSSTRLDGEMYSLGEQVQYTDIWANDNYLQFMYERLLMLKELLTEDGSLYLHCDWNKSHLLRCILEEVFSPEFLRNEVVWKRTSARSDSKTYNHIHDTIYLVTKGDQFTWNKLKLPYSQEYIDRYFTMVDKVNGKRFSGTDLTARGLRNGSTGKPWRGFDPSTKGNHWKYTIEKLNELNAEGRIYWPEAGGWPRQKQYLEDAEGVAIQSIWTDLYVINSQAQERTDYPTQKPEDILERIIGSSSNPGDLILDCFAGSGTTAAVAQKLGRRWIIADINKGAVQTASKRLQRIIQEQVEGREKSTQLALLPEDTKGEPQPAQLAFAVYRVNDYDLQIQHNEALNLAIEHVGIERLKGDPFFEGTLGKRLVKIIPFNHPLTRLDLQMIQDELKKRSSEDRDIIAVCLGKELAADAWLAEYNHHHPVNKISVIELRTDPRYGKFFEHQPASAEVHVMRKDGKIVVDIEDFISPTILERLEMDSGMFKAKITDWRAMVDTVLIDVAYDGEVFNVALSDVPERKADLVVGHYELPAPADATTVAVKIIDMLGEELLEIHDV